MQKICHIDVEVVKLKKSLLKLKDQAHLYFDKIWQLKYMERNEAYEWLAGWLGVAEPESHMSTMDTKRCKDVIEASIQLLNDMRRLDLDFGADIKHPYYELT